MTPQHRPGPFQDAVARATRLRQDAAAVAFLAATPGPVPERPVPIGGRRAPLAEYAAAVAFLTGEPAGASTDGARMQQLDGTGGTTPVDSDVPDVPDLGIGTDHEICGPPTNTTCGLPDDFTVDGLGWVPLNDAGLTFWTSSVLAPDSIPWPTCERNLFMHAWGFLQVNWDLVEWAVCMATNDTGAGDCIHATLFGHSVPNPLLAALGLLVGQLVLVETDIKILLLDDDCNFLDLPVIRMATEPFGRMTAVCGAEDTDYRLAKELYCANSSDDRDCAVVKISASILHELTHICNRSLRADRAENCPVSYQVGNNFLWAAMQRVVSAQRSSCCGFWDGIVVGDANEVPLFSPCEPQGGGAIGPWDNPGTSPVGPPRPFEWTIPSSSDDYGDSSWVGDDLMEQL
ncbi:MAG: hypothetical protein ABMB14_10375 [Myxococcota bacterium]